MKYLALLFLIPALASAQKLANADGSNVSGASWKTNLEFLQAADVSSAYVPLTSLSSTGGNDKIPKYDSVGDLTTATAGGTGVGVAGGGNIYLPDLKGLQWLYRNGNKSTAKIVMWEEHGGWPELIVDSIGRIALIPYAGMQFGPNDAGKYPRYIQMVSGSSSSTTALNYMPSGALMFQTSAWNGSSNVVNHISMQAHALDTSGTNSTLKFYDQSTVSEAGTSVTAGRGDVTGNLIAEVYKDGIWSAGTAPTFATLTASANVFTQTCSKYKTVQAAKLTLGATNSLAISGALAGMRGIIYVAQDSTGSRTLTLPAGSITETGFALTTGAGSAEKSDRLEWEYDGANYFWTIKKGFDLAYVPTDSDASAYISAVETALGSSIPSGKRNAIDSFIIAEKAANRWTSQKRLYLPVWANAAANAIDMKTLAVGTFANSPTQGAGYIQGNATNQYFDMGASPATLGMTMASNGMTLLFPENTTSNASATGVNSGANYMFAYFGANAEYKFGSMTQSAALASNARLGIFDFNRVGTTTAIYNRRASGNTTLVSSTIADSGSVPSGYNIWSLGINAIGSLSGWNGKIGAISVHSGFSSSDSAGFTDNLKTLWQTCSGLTLP